MIQKWQFYSIKLHKIEHKFNTFILVDHKTELNVESYTIKMQVLNTLYILDHCAVVIWNKKLQIQMRKTHQIGTWTNDLVV